MHKVVKYLLLILIFQVSINISEEKISIPDFTKEMQKYEGFITYYWDSKKGNVWLEIDKLGKEFLYVNLMPRGIGSNDIGLDRGQVGGNRIVKFERYGPKVLLVQPNYDYRAITNNTFEKKAVEHSFAVSVLHGFDIEVEDQNKVLINATSFFIRDAHNIVGILKNRNQGSYSLDLSKSAIYLSNTKNFPKNSEIEVLLTFSGDDPGKYVRSVVPTPELITVHQRHSFIELPDENYKPRIFDPRAGYYGISYFDYASPIDENIVKRFISRHRLIKKESGKLVSEAIEPIVYYVDNGAPKDIQDALIEGASWWNQAFEAAGFKNAFRVELLPENADPMDVRYNVIQWVHRSTRGWSYGASVIDPRTGEIIKGHVSLGSLRVRQDLMIAQGLTSPFNEGNENTEEISEMALARIRQLSAHEVGHTLGISHNFAASAKERASVMDYPYPYVKLNGEGKIDLSEVYDNKIGEWDKIAIQYGYSQFSSGADESIQLQKIINESISNGFIYITDKDARPKNGAHSTAHLWDNGSDAAEELSRIMKIREVALKNFGKSTIKMGEPYSNLEDVLVPIYLFHRYQVEAAVKLLGGVYYTYALKGDGQEIVKNVPPKLQIKTLDELVLTLKADNLAIPKSLLNLMPPKVPGYYRGRENFIGKTDPTFDPISAAETAAGMTLELILNSERCNRLFEQSLLNDNYPSLELVLEKLIKSSWESTEDDKYKSEINRTVSFLVLSSLFKLTMDQNASTQVKAISLNKIVEIKNFIDKKIVGGDLSTQSVFYSYVLNRINDFMKNGDKYIIYNPANLPDGSPIGSGSSGGVLNCNL